jgi:hypothetical protein
MTERAYSIIIALLLLCSNIAMGAVPEEIRYISMPAELKSLVGGCSQG